MKKVALVTGATSGIGKAIALRLANEDFNVVVCGRRKDRLEALAEGNENIHPQRCDVRSLSHIRSLFSDIRKRWGGLHVLVNNAGVGYKGTFFDSDPEQWREMLEVNVLALSVCTAEALSDKNTFKIENIINIGSMAGHRVPNQGGMYCATKFAVSALTESLRRQLREKKQEETRITQISPGMVESEFFDHYLGDSQAATQLMNEQKLLTPQDVADAVWFAIQAPKHVNIGDIQLRSVQQDS